MINILKNLCQTIRKVSFLRRLIFTLLFAQSIHNKCSRLSISHCKSEMYLRKKPKMKSWTHWRNLLKNRLNYFITKQVFLLNVIQCKLGRAEHLLKIRSKFEKERRKSIRFSTEFKEIIECIPTYLWSDKLIDKHDLVRN